MVAGSVLISWYRFMCVTACPLSMMVVCVHVRLFSLHSELVQVIAS